MNRRTQLLPIAATLLLSLPARATTYLIEADGTGDFPTIQAAVQAASNGDIIELADGVFTGPGNRSIDFSGKEVTIQSQARSPVHCVIDCEDVTRAFHLHNGEGRGAAIRWLTIRNGWDIPGGAILCDGASPTIAYCRISGNYSEDGNGGAIACYDSGPEIHGNSISGNFGGWAGGAIFCRTNSGHPRTVIIADNFFFGNYADGIGGAIACDTVYPIIRGNRIESNTTADWGGGIWLEDCFGVIEDNLFLRNTANYGGAVYCLESNLQFDRNTMAWNHGDEAGGGIYFSGSNSILDRNTLHGNSTDLWGGGIACTNASSPQIDRTIIDGSTGGGEAVYCSGGSMPTLSCCDLYANAGGDWVGYIAPQNGIRGNFSANPIYCDSSSDDFTLHSSSPCAWANSSGCGYVGAWYVACGSTATLGESEVNGLELSTGPNPMRDRGWIRYAIPPSSEPSRMDLRIIDSAGRLVRTIVDGDVSRGSRNVDWDGRNQSGVPVAGGVYFVRLRVVGSVSGERQLTRPIVLLR